MQVRAAYGAAGDLDDDVAVILDSWIRHLVASYVAFAVPCEGFHRFAPELAEC
jgi:hypothetical protein